MNSVTCPGISKFIRPVPEYIACPNCQAKVEIWSDETTAKCDNCGTATARAIASCLDHCEQSHNCKEIIEKRSMNSR